MQIPKQSIAWFVGRLHVSVTDEQVKADIRKRTAGVDPAWPESKIAEAEKYAVKCHHANQELYRVVMSGKF